MSFFKFKQFTIHQDKSAMKVGTDSILLGSWLTINKECQTVLDIGTGTGLLALMVAQKSNLVRVTGLEVDENSYHQAKYNVKHSKWFNRINLCLINANHWESKIKFDLIISNPPYFTPSSISNNEARNKARQQGTLSLNNLIDLWLKFGSNIAEYACVLPTDQANRLIDLCIESSLHLKKQTLIRSNNQSKIIRKLLLFSKQTLPTEETEVCIYNSKRDYTKAFTELTQDFYL